MKILITGYYGAGNFGDDIMLESFCKEMQNDKISISILKMFNKKIEINLDKKIKIINFYKIKRMRSFLFRIIVKKYDMFLWVGGTCFTDQDGDGFYDFMKIAKESRVKIGYIGVGVGELSNEERIKKTKYLSNNCDFMTLRDEYSYKYICKLKGNNKNTFLTEDLAYIFVNKLSSQLKGDKVRSEAAGRKIVVSWRNLINYKSETEELMLIDKIVDFIKYVASEKFETEIVILPLDDRRDLDKNKLIYDKLCSYNNDKVNISYKANLTPIEKINVILSCDINISSRLHGIFVSEINNIKTIGISYSIKINEFLKSIGKEEDFIYIDNLSVDELKIIYNKKSKILNKDLVNKKINKSFENITLLKKYLESNN